MKTENFINLSSQEVCYELEKRKGELLRLMQLVEKRRQQAPAGTLRVAQRKQGSQYYWRTEQKDSIGKYLHKSELDLAKKLAQKEYDRKILKELEAQYKEIERFLERYHPKYIEEILMEMHEGKKSLIDPVIQSTEAYIALWKNVEYLPKGFDDDNTEYYTDAGERVRSKSEIIIANKLLKMGIPYRYEYPILFASGRKIYPDFYCLNARTREEFIWEHFGMMDNPEYANHAVRKLDEYQKNEYWCGKNMIATFETAEKPLNVSVIEKMIEQFLL